MNIIQKHFPQIQYLKKNHQAYLDNAATTLKPQCVIDTVNQFYKERVSNVHRGDHYLSNNLTLSYEQIRSQVQKYIRAEKSDEIIFTKSTTEGLNFLSHALEDLFQSGDEILLTEMEHHSNILPWQVLAKKKNLIIKYLPVDKNGEILLSEWDNLVNEKTKLFAFTYYSNALGTRNPVEKLISLAKQRNILTVIDAAQAMTAEFVNVQNIGCDFLAFSGHKLFAPTGIGVLYIKHTQFEKLKPWQVGGGMVTDVSVSGYEPADPPQCFEAGTPPIEGVLGLGAALKFLEENKENIAENKAPLLQYAEEELKKIPDIEIIGTSSTRVNILSFVLKPSHCRDVGQLISQTGVAVRSGHHCCLPLMKKLNLDSGTVRASFSIYNDEQDVHLLVSAIKKTKEILL